MRCVRTWLLVMLLPTLGGAAVASADETSEHREDQFKAAYLFNFVQFVAWPAGSPTDILTVCFTGGQGVYDAFASGIESKRAGGRRVAALKLKPTDKASGCNAIYFEGASGSGAGGLPALDAPVLTVSDAKAFAVKGGIIELFKENNRFRFNINVGNARKCGLRISSSLLELAASVDDRALP